MRLREQVLEGLERALITMKKAEQVVVTISSEYLHDQNALQRNNATNRSFYYEVELVDFVKVSCSYVLCVSVDSIALKLKENMGSIL
ncbi:hypothetical protein RIF29_14815 [Crotalaria pallida]|uniref:peptidylprolyl isomerase n=1 Tax=Crotalaria pallida TaxID=3830 RepID=A0AAN9FCB1_CROPI